MNQSEYFFYFGQEKSRFDLWEKEIAIRPFLLTVEEVNAINSMLYSCSTMFHFFLNIEEWNAVHFFFLLSKWTVFFFLIYALFFFLIEYLSKVNFILE